LSAVPTWGDGISSAANSARERSISTRVSGSAGLSTREQRPAAIAAAAAQVKAAAAANEVQQAAVSGGLQGVAYAAASA
jgi:hypothetical protein